MLELDGNDTARGSWVEVTLAYGAGPGSAAVAIEAPKATEAYVMSLTTSPPASPRAAIASNPPITELRSY